MSRVFYLLARVWIKPSTVCRSSISVPAWIYAIEDICEGDGWPMVMKNIRKYRRLGGSPTTILVVCGTNDGRE